MSGEWREVPFSEAVLVNPAVRLNRGTVYPFVDMAAVNAGSRNAPTRRKNESLRAMAPVFRTATR